MVGPRIHPPVPGRYRYTVIAWMDQFESWRKELERREELNDIRIALQVGSTLVPMPPIAPPAPTPPA